jgi:hypothetical protein
MSAFLDNSPGDTDATVAVEDNKGDNKRVDCGDVSDDKTED